MEFAMTEHSSGVGQLDEPLLSFVPGDIVWHKPQSRARFVDRSGHFSQSRGRLNIERKGKSAALAVQSWFHFLIAQSTYKVIYGFPNVFLSNIFSPNCVISCR